MLSSLNAYGGMSAVDLLKLFGANSSSSTSSSTSAGGDQSASTGVLASSANDPANAIKAILAQTQIAQSRTTASGAVSIATVASAYASQTETSADQSSTSTTAETAYVVQMGSSSSILATGVTMSNEVTTDAASGLSIGYSITSVPSASTSGGTSNPQSDADYFQLDLTLGQDSITVGFMVDGLGQVGTSAIGNGYSFGRGTQDTVLQMSGSLGGTGVGFDLNLTGLSAAQSHDVQAAFQSATSSNNGTIDQLDGSGFSYDENLGSGFTANFSAWGSGN
jgi:hypothetical protein